MNTSLFRCLLPALLGLAAPVSGNGAHAAPLRPLSSLSASMSPYEPATLRRHYQAAATAKAAAGKFYQLLADYNDKNALVLAYKAAAEAIRARDASMLHKLDYVKQAGRTFEQAVALDPDNVEIRFLRFSVESNVPAFLGLSKHVEEDRARLVQAALAYPKSNLDPEVFRTVRNFLLDHKHVSQEQAQQLGKVKA